MSNVAIALRILGALSSSEGENSQGVLVATVAVCCVSLVMTLFAPILIVALLLMCGWGYTVEQSTQTTSSSYTDSGIDYQEVSLEGVTYFNQTDSQWGQESYGSSSTIAKAGCGPTSMAIVISTLLGEIHNPLELADWSYDNGYCFDGYGSYHALIPAAGEAYGLDQVSPLGSNTEAVMQWLEDGGLVVAIMGEGHFTSSGHFIVLRGVTEGGTILVADPASYQRSCQDWDPDIIWDEAKIGASAGGPFWGFK